MNTSSDERLVVMLEARIRDFEKNMARAEQRGTRSYQRLRRDSRTATQGMEQDMVRSTGRINQALATTSTKIGSLGKAFLGGAVAGIATTALAGITQNITQTVKGIAQIGDEAKRAGMGLQAFQEWTAVAERSRIGMDALVDGFKELNLRADEFIITGGGSASEAFKRLGYSAADLKVKLKDPSALMLEIIDRMQSLDAAARIRISDELLGGTGGEQFVQLLDRGADGVRGIMEEARRTGRVLDEELIRKAQEIDERFTAMTQKFAAWGKVVAVALADLPFDIVETRLREIFPDEAFGRSVLGDEIFDRLKDLRDLTDAQVEATQRLASAQSEMGEEGRSAANAILLAMNELPSQEFADIRAQLSDIATEMRKASGEFESGAITADTFGKRMGDAETEAAALFETLEKDHGITLSTAISAVGRLAQRIADAIGLARTLKASLPGGVAKEVPGYLDSAEGPGVVWADDPNAPTMRPKRAPNDDWWREPVTPAGGGKGGKGKARRDEFERSVEQIKDQTRALEAEAATLVAVAKGGKDYGDALEFARKRAELLNAAQKAGKAITPELKAEIDALAGSYVTAGLNADAARDKLESIKQIGDRVSGALQSAFDGIFEDPKQALADLAKQLAMLALKMQLAKMMPGVFGAGGIIPLGFSDGGYTGPGRVNDPAGVVHKGEVVWSQRDVARAGGVATVEAMRLGRRGYDAGGAVGGASSGAGGFTFQLIDQRPAGSGDLQVEQQSKRGPNYREIIIATVKEEMQRGRLDGPMRNKYGVKPTKVMY